MIRNLCAKCTTGSLIVTLLLLRSLGALPAAAQDDVTTQNGSSGYERRLDYRPCF